MSLALECGIPGASSGLKHRGIAEDALNWIVAGPHKKCKAATGRQGSIPLGSTSDIKCIEDDSLKCFGNIRSRSAKPSTNAPLQRTGRAFQYADGWNDAPLVVVDRAARAPASRRRACQLQAGVRDTHIVGAPTIGAVIDGQRGGAALALAWCRTVGSSGMALLPPRARRCSPRKRGNKTQNRGGRPGWIVGCFEPRKKIDLATGETRRGPGFSSRVGRPRAGVELTSGRQLGYRN